MVYHIEAWFAALSKQHTSQHHVYCAKPPGDRTSKEDPFIQLLLKWIVYTNKVICEESSYGADPI